MKPIELKIWKLQSETYFLKQLTLINMRKIAMFSIAGKVYSTTIACSLYVNFSEISPVEILAGAYLFDLTDLNDT